MNKNIPCCFSEVNEIGKHITSCNNLPTKLDEDNVQVRYFCEEHMTKVEIIRRKMAQKYINEYKEKLIEYLNREIKGYDFLDKNKQSKIDYEIWTRTKQIYQIVLKHVENGDFDND